MKSRIIVIGGLAAGPAAASKAARTNPEADVLLFEKNDSISYGICELPWFINNKIQQKDDLILFSPEKFQSEKRVIVKTLHSVREIIPQRKTITVHNLEKEKLEQYNYDKLIITAGSIPNEINFISPAFTNVFYLKSLYDAINIKKFIDYNHPKKATIFGAGFIAMEMAESFASLGIEVTILNIENLPLRGFEDETRQFALDILKKQGIKYREYKEINNTEASQENHIKKIYCGEVLVEQDIILIAAGIKPNNFLAKPAGIPLGKNGGILVDSKMLTGTPNIYAAGDCIELRNLLTNKHFYSPFATTALKTGWAAGENAVGGNSVIRGSIPAYTVSFFNAEVAHVGLTLNEAHENRFDAGKEFLSGWAKPKIFPGADKTGVVLIFDKRDGRILGADIFGSSGSALRANIISTAIYQKLTIKDLVNLDFAYSPPSTPQHDPILYAAAKVLKNNKIF